MIYAQYRKNIGNFKIKKMALEQEYSIFELRLFGSYARGDQNEKSDIDILVDLVSRKGIKARYLPSLEKSLVHV